MSYADRWRDAPDVPAIAGAAELETHCFRRHGLRPDRLPMVACFTAAAILDTLPPAALHPALTLAALARRDGVVPIWERRPWSVASLADLAAFLRRQAWQGLGGPLPEAPWTGHRRRGG